MQGNDKVIAALQAAMNAEATLAEVYKLNGRALCKKLGLKTGKELKELGCQCRGYMKKIAKRLELFEVFPEVEPATATVGKTTTETIDDLIGMELAAVKQYTQDVVACWNAKDMDCFHFFQHMCKWHTVGENGNVGHLNYLQHERRQLTEFGEKDYEEVHA